MVAFRDGKCVACKRCRRSSRRLVRGRTPDAAAIGRLATEGGYIEHWARALDANKPLIAAFMVVAWSKGCYDKQIISADEKTGWPDFASVPNMRRRFFKHPFLLLPLSDLFVDVWQKCVAMLASEQKQ